MCACVCVWKNTEKPKEQTEKCAKMVNKTGSENGQKVVRKYKNTRNTGKCVETRSPLLTRYGHPWTPKRSKNSHFSRHIVLTLSLGFVNVFGRKSYPKRPKMRSWVRGPIPKVPNMRWKKSSPTKNTLYLKCHHLLLTAVGLVLPGCWHYGTHCVQMTTKHLLSFWYPTTTFQI